MFNNYNCCKYWLTPLDLTDVNRYTPSNVYVDPDDIII